MAFIVFEGIDGSGLSTQASLLKEYLGENALLTKEPTDGPIGMLIRTALKGRIKFDNTTISLLFAADRADHIKNIKQIQKTKKIKNIICDRYYLSNYAYQSINNTTPINTKLEFLKKINSNAPKPDLTIFIDVPAEVCIRRIKKNRFHIELYENTKILDAVRKNYHAIIKEQKEEEKENIEIVDGDRDIEEVRKDIIKIYKKFFTAL